MQINIHRWNFYFLIGYRPLIRRICLRGVLESKSYNKEFVFWAGVAGKVAQIGQFHCYISHQ